MISLNPHTAKSSTSGAGAISAPSTHKSEPNRNVGPDIFTKFRDYCEELRASATTTLSQHQSPSETQEAATPPTVDPLPAGAAIGELRRFSGLTWEQLARLCHVSRRALHFWASGKEMAPSNQERLQRLLSTVRFIDRGSASANRAALLSGGSDGVLPFDLLVDGEFERVKALLGAGGARRPKPPPLSAEARAARAPQPPWELLGALQDSIHPNSGRLLAAKVIRIPRRK